ncbi:hypothetical protein AABB24_027358 [Solanum stoloniferum]|uniref:Uncharacterized protein n=1 Tax=Solanum stoloniferum TaxID=62892 RepID=A0ABD2SIT4_9SOLN
MEERDENPDKNKAHFEFKLENLSPLERNTYSLKILPNSKRRKGESTPQIDSNVLGEQCGSISRSQGQKLGLLYCCDCELRGTEGRRQNLQCTVSAFLAAFLSIIVYLDVVWETLSRRL